MQGDQLDLLGALPASATQLDSSAALLQLLERRCAHIGGAQLLGGCCHLVNLKPVIARGGAGLSGGRQVGFTGGDLAAVVQVVIFQGFGRVLEQGELAFERGIGRVFALNGVLLHAHAALRRALHGGELVHHRFPVKPGNQS